MPKIRSGRRESYHWGEPEAGYFLSKDEYVIRKDMSMLADAGVDVLIMDVTNAVRYWDEWAVIFAVMREDEGRGQPGAAVLLLGVQRPGHHGGAGLVRQDLQGRENTRTSGSSGMASRCCSTTARPAWTPTAKAAQNPNPHYDPAAKTDPKNPHYGDPDYTDEFYQDYTKEVKSFFTLRTMWWGYYEWAGKRFVGTEDNWSFGLDMGDKRVAAMTPGRTGLDSTTARRKKRPSRPRSIPRA